jgi:hypothetical protein
MTSPRNRYSQVARTYARAIMLPTVVLTAAYFVFLYACYPPIAKAQRFGYLAALMWITAGSAAIVTAHVKTQLADARAAITPGYRKPHLLLGAVALLAISAGCAALAMPGLEFSLAGLIALALVVAASTAWFMQLQNLAAGLVCNVLWLSLLSPSVVFAVGAMLEGRNPALAVVLIASGLAALVALWMRLERMHEGMGEFARRSLPLVALRPGATAIASGGVGIDPWFESVLRRPIETRCIATANAWVRVRHLRATGLGRMPWVMAALMAGSMVVVPWLTGGRDNPAAGALESFVFVTMILPPVLAIGHWTRRWPSLGYESLRPASRSRFIRELGFVMALDLAEAWLVVTVASIIPLLVWSPQALADLATSGFFVLSAATAIVVFALNVWLLRLRSTLLSVLALALTGLSPAVPFVLNRGHGGAGVILPIAAGMLVLGALVTLDAYARWRRTDFE